MNDGEIRLTDVESPRWMTDAQDVRGGPGTVVGGAVVGTVGDEVVGGGVVAGSVVGVAVGGGPTVTRGGSAPSDSCGGRRRRGRASGTVVAAAGPERDDCHGEEENQTMGAARHLCRLYAARLAR